MSDWIIIYETGQVWQAELRKGLLEEHDIDSVIVNKKDSAYLFGEVELWVQTANVIQAKTLLSKLDDEQLP